MLGWLKRFFLGEPAPDQSPLAKQAHSAEPGARERAAAQLGEVSGPWAADQLLEMLRDAHASVREAARTSLGRQGPAAFPALCRGLNHADAQVGRAAAEILGERREPEAVAPLLGALKYGARPVQNAARVALERLGDLAVPALEAAREEQQPWAQRQIEEALAQIKRASAVAPAAPPP